MKQKAEGLHVSNGDVFLNQDNPLNHSEEVTAMYFTISWKYNILAEFT